MRTIKFRGQRIDTKEWVYGDLIHAHEGIFIGDTRCDESTCYKIEYCEIIVIPATIGQFIGLADNNGKEIYEHDRVRIKGGEEWQGVRELDKICTVRFLDGEICAVDDNGTCYSFGMIEEIEIVGSIHDKQEE